MRAFVEGILELIEIVWREDYQRNTTLTPEMPADGCHQRNSHQPQHVFLPVVRHLTTSTGQQAGDDLRKEDNQEDENHGRPEQSDAHLAPFSALVSSAVYLDEAKD
jgi:hypothetical protein